METKVKQPYIPIKIDNKGFDWLSRLDARMWYACTHAWRVHPKDDPNSVHVFGINPPDPKPIKLFTSRSGFLNLAKNG